MAHRILLLGPDPAQLRGLQSALIRAGQQAAYAEEIQQGGALAQQFHPSLIALVTDLNAPRGREDLATLMMHPKLQALPIFILTRGIPTHVAVGALRTGASELVIMPTKLEVFLARVATSIGDVPGHAAAIAAVDRKGPALLKRIGNYLRRMAADAELRIEGTSEPGLLIFKDGRIVDAKFGKMTGTTAIQRLLTEPSNRPWSIMLASENSKEAPALSETLPATPSVETPRVELHEAMAASKKSVSSSTLKAPSLPPPAPEEIDFDVDEETFSENSTVDFSIDLDSLDDVGVELFDEDIIIDDLGAPSLPQPTAEALSMLATAKVLLVDDDPDLLKLYEKFLHKRGYDVFTAENGKLGYALAKEIRPDVIVSDIMMPETDGWGFLTLIRRDAHLHDTPFLLLSCHGEYLEKLKKIEAGADDYLKKGLRGDAVVERVAAALSAHRNLAAALEPGLTFGGMLQDVGLRYLVNALSDKKVHGILSIEDRFARYTLQISEQKLVQITCEAGLSQKTGDDALSSIMGIKNAYFEFSATEDVRALASSENIESAFDRVAEKLNDSRQDVNEHLFAANSKLICDAELTRFYLVVCPDMARPIARALFDGIAPRELLGSGNYSPILVEWVVQDMLRKQVGQFQNIKAA